MKTTLVDVELLSKVGGGRTYTYRYNLHYTTPRKGDFVIVPFGGRLFPAIVLSTDENIELGSRIPPAEDGENATSRRAEFALRPILGVEREDRALLELGALGRAMMERYLRPAKDAFSLWVAGTVERELGVFFFAPEAKKGCSHTSKAWLAGV